MTATTKIAIARPVTPTVYNVTYPGSRDMDADVGYDYLRRLASSGWTVQVGGVANTPAHTIPAAK